MWRMFGFQNSLRAIERQTYSGNRVSSCMPKSNLGDRPASYPIEPKQLNFFSGVEQLIKTIYP